MSELSCTRVNPASFPALPLFPPSPIRVAAVFGIAMALGTAPASANSKYAGIVIDAKTGKTLYAHDADAQRYPASLTKMMTLYLVFEALERGKIRLDTRVKFSANAAKEPPTKLGVGNGKSDHGRAGDLCPCDKIRQRRVDGHRRTSGRLGSQVCKDDDCQGPLAGHEQDDIPQCSRPAELGPGDNSP